MADDATLNFKIKTEGDGGALEKSLGGIAGKIDDVTKKVAPLKGAFDKFGGPEFKGALDGITQSGSGLKDSLAAIADAAKNGDTDLGAWQDKLKAAGEQTIAFGQQLYSSFLSFGPWGAAAMAAAYAIRFLVEAEAEDVEVLEKGMQKRAEASAQARAAAAESFEASLKQKEASDLARIANEESTASEVAKVSAIKATTEALSARQQTEMAIAEAQRKLDLARIEADENLSKVEKARATAKVNQQAVEQRQAQELESRKQKESELLQQAQLKEAEAARKADEAAKTKAKEDELRQTFADKQAAEKQADTPAISKDLFSEFRTLYPIFKVPGASDQGTKEDIQILAKRMVELLTNRKSLEKTNPEMVDSEGTRKMEEFTNRVVLSLEQVTDAEARVKELEAKFKELETALGTGPSSLLSKNAASKAERDAAELKSKADVERQRRESTEKQFSIENQTSGLTSEVSIRRAAVLDTKESERKTAIENKQEAASSKMAEKLNQAADAQGEILDGLSRLLNNLTATATALKIDRE